MRELFVFDKRITIRMELSENDYWSRGLYEKTESLP